MSEQARAAYLSGYDAGREDRRAVDERAVDAAVDEAVEELRRLYPPDWRRTRVEIALQQISRLPVWQTGATAEMVSADRKEDHQ